MLAGWRQWSCLAPNAINNRQFIQYVWRDHVSLVNILKLITVHCKVLIAMAKTILSSAKGWVGRFAIAKIINIWIPGFPFPNHEISKPALPMIALFILVFSISLYRLFHHRRRRLSRCSIPKILPIFTVDIQFKSKSNYKRFELGPRNYLRSRLSSDGTISCAFVTNKKFAFTHHGHTVVRRKTDKLELKKLTSNSKSGSNHVCVWQQPII
jgi:hypothetical protein